MKIDKIPRDMDGDELPQTIPIIHVTADEPFEQQCARLDGLAGTHEAMARRQRPYLGDAVLQDLLFLCAQVLAASAQQEFFRQHACFPTAIPRT
ncbi:hypothetical protein [Sphingomonas aerolata]|uniref:hypothetical protein n=1 Tax=Sphingomonas aerolata TaxID=185951 RepID=UPI001D87A9A8|nr:hypothetical protein [Sphingomonas aerolata]